MFSPPKPYAGRRRRPPSSPALACDLRIDEGLEEEGLPRLRRHDERAYSFVDATSFAFIGGTGCGRHSPSTVTSRPPDSSTSVPRQRPARTPGPGGASWFRRLVASVRRVGRQR